MGSDFPDLFGLFPEKVKLRDVTLRDGLQSEKVQLALELKVALVRQIKAAGIREMEITAFVNPRKVPAMADAEQLWGILSQDTDMVFSALVFNQKGLERALSSGVQQIAVVVSASEAHSVNNAGQGIQKALAEAIDVLGQAKASGMSIRAVVASAFGCNMEGEIPVSRVRSLLEAFSQQAPEEVALADTSGSGNPRKIMERVQLCREIMGERRLSLHFHNASGWAFSNLLVALQMGVETFDVTVGALGGCPFLPGAAGNLSTEHVVKFLEAMGVDTGIDTAPVQIARKMLEEHLGRQLTAPT